MSRDKKKKRSFNKYGWMVKFPAVLAKTIQLKVKNRSCDYLSHQNEVYSNELFTDDSDKFHSVRENISSYAKMGGNESVIEIGTGAGWQARSLADKGFSKVVAIDAVPERIEYCKRLHNNENIEFMTMDAASLEFESDSFDTAVVSAMLHDLPPEIKEKALSEAIRVAKNKLVIFEPRTFRNGLFGSVYGALGELLDESLHFREFAKSSLNDSLKRKGAKILYDESAWFGMMKITVCKLNSSGQQSG